MAFSSTVDSMPVDPPAYSRHQQALRMKTQSSAASSRSKTAQSSRSTSTSSKKRRNQTASVRERTVVVFDWDDTLCPSSWLNDQALVPQFQGQEIAFTPDQQAQLRSVAEHVIRLLKKAVSFGPVFVVTAAEYGWVELSASLFLPGVREVLELPDIHIVSARSWYEQTFGLGGDSNLWKHEVMLLIARKCFGHAYLASTASDARDDTFFNLVSIGDSTAERDACHSAVVEVPSTLAKTLKFVDRPTPSEIMQQVELASDSFEYLCGWSSALDLQLSREQLATLAHVWR